MLYPDAISFKITVCNIHERFMQECIKWQWPLPFYSIILEHRNLINANLESLNANNESFDGNLENLNDSERLNANSKYSNQPN